MRHCVPFAALIPASALTRVMALVVVSLIGLGWQVQAQTLTPGAAAIGGTTGTGELIGPGGSSGSSSTTPTRSTPSTGGSTPRRNPRIHYPSNSWPMPLPPVRTQVEGQPISAFDPAGSQTQTPQVAETPEPVDTQDTGSEPTSDEALAALTPVFDPQGDGEPEVAPEPEPIQPEPEVIPEPEPEEATAETDTNAVTAGATDDNAPSAETDSNLSPPSSSADFRMTALNFGQESITLSDEHIGQLQQVVNLMRNDPNVPLRVVAILAQAQANSEDAKLVARRRILAVRRYILDQGLGAENLTFVISSNAQSEQFADHVLIQR